MRSFLGLHPISWHSCLNWYQVLLSLSLNSYQLLLCFAFSWYFLSIFFNWYLLNSSWWLHYQQWGEIAQRVSLAFGLPTRDKKKGVVEPKGSLALYSYEKESTNRGRACIFCIRLCWAFTSSWGTNGLSIVLRSCTLWALTSSWGAMNSLSWLC